MLLGLALLAAAGALQDLSGSRDQFENNQAWLQSLTESCTMDGKLMCAPYLAGSRAVIYRKSMFAKAGITEPPASLAELQADAQKLMSTFGDDKRFSAFYFPGKYWYAALPFVWTTAATSPSRTAASGAAPSTAPSPRPA